MWHLGRESATDAIFEHYLWQFSALGIGPLQHFAGAICNLALAASMGRCPYSIGRKQPMEAGTAGQDDTGPRAVAGRMKGMRHMWMRFEPCSPEAYLMYVGGHKAKRSPQRAYSLHAAGRPHQSSYRIGRNAYPRQLPHPCPLPQGARGQRSRYSHSSRPSG